MCLHEWGTARMSLLPEHEVKAENIRDSIMKGMEWLEVEARLPFYSTDFLFCSQRGSHLGALLNDQIT